MWHMPFHTNEATNYLFLQGAIKASSAVSRVDTWYRREEGQQRTCPNCRESCAYVETCKINGLDFLTAIAPVLDVDSIDHEDKCNTQIS